MNHHELPRRTAVPRQTVGGAIALIFRWRKWLFPGFLALSILLALVPGQDGWLGFNIAIMPMVLGGGFITFNTLVAVMETRKVTAGLLVVIAIIGSAYAGEYLAAAIVALMMISGEFLEDLTLERTRNAVRELVRLVPDTARVWRDNGWLDVQVTQVHPGDRVLVRPGDMIPVDGKVAAGQAAVNQASLTGESMPVDKGPGDPVFVGTVSESGAMEIMAEKVGPDTAMGRIIQVVYEAQARKGQTQKIADRFAQYFTPVILLICLGVWLGTHELIRVMAILVIACPCALVLATPTAVVASVGNAARRGALIKGGVTLETAGRVNAICLDKTGTLTVGQPQVIALIPWDGLSSAELIQLAASAEEQSEHPIARAIMLYAGQNCNYRSHRIAGFEQVFGAGVCAMVEGRKVWVGNRRVLDKAAPCSGADAALQFIQEQEAMGRTALIVVADGTYMGGLALADPVRTGAAEAISLLKKAGIRKVVMATGDNLATAAAVAAEAGVDEVHACLLPAEKLSLVEGLKAKGYRIAMVGDGVNDAPALALADVGIAMGAAGTDVAIESAGIALMGDNLQMLPEVLLLSRKALQIIQQNIWVFAVGVNTGGIALASSGLLSPVGAAIVHNVASFLVVLNSARLLTYRSRAVRNTRISTRTAVHRA